MRYNIDFELLGAMVTLAIAYNFKRNYVSRTRSENTFIQMVYFILGSQILDMVSAYTICLEKPEFNVINHILTSGYFLCAFATSVAFERYIVTYITEVGRNRIYVIAKNIVIVAYTVFSLLNPFTGLAFTFDENGIYHHGSLYITGYIAPALFMLAAMFFVIRYRRCFARKQWVSSVFFIIIVFGAMTLQIAVLTDLYLTFGVIPVALLMVMFSLETPDYRKLMHTMEELENAKQEALSANRVKSAFLANMSHEIRTPINSMLGFNEMILRETDDEEIFSYASNVKSSGNALLALVNDILDLSKIEAGKMEIVPAEYSILNSLSNLHKMISPRAVKKGLELEYEIDSGIPKKLFADEVRLSQVLTNLLTNAIKYTEKGEVTLEVKIKERHGDRVKLLYAVKDTGMGIKEENIEKLFSEFTRVEEKTHKIEGTGLGLPITVKCLKLMGSELKVISKVGQGSVFYFEIEQRIIDEEPIGDFEEYLLENHSEVEVFRENFTAPDAHILVVDDVEMNLKVFKGLLKSSMMQIDTAESGREAIELIKKNDYDLVFMDHQMPEMDGIETLEKIINESVADTEKLPFIALTANAISGAREMYLKSGFSDYLTKPIEGRALSEMLRKWLPEEKIQNSDNTNKKSDSLKNRSIALNNDPEKEQKDLSEENNSKDSDGKAERAEKTILQKLSDLGIDVKTGMGYAMDDEEFYLEIIHDFATGMEKYKGELAEYAARKDTDNYGVKVHALKSSAKTIGALGLSEKAKELEFAAKNKNIDFIEANNEQVLDEYQKLTENILKVLEL